MTDVDEVIKSTLDERDIAYDRPESGKFFVTLPGTKKLQTNCWLIVGEHALVVEAFVCRRPDEAREEVYRFLLRRNAKLYGVHYTIDSVGDIYLLGPAQHDETSPSPAPHPRTSNDDPNLLSRTGNGIRDHPDPTRVANPEWIVSNEVTRQGRSARWS